MTAQYASAIAANRFGLGAKPGDLARIGAEPRAWLTRQLQGGPPQIQDAGLRPSADILTEGFKIQRERRDARQAQKSSGGAASGEAAAAANFMKLPQLYRPIYMTETLARWREATTTERPLLERLTHFWTNHFAVSVDKITTLGLAGAYEREAIRPNVLGKFADLLLAAERHPAMLLYLDNHQSVGPNSTVARRVAQRGGERKLGINENLAREIMELHTLGVDGGYSQTDVTTFAQVITGWSIGGSLGRLRGGEPGHFMFRPELHEPGAKTLLGKRYSDRGEEQGVAVLRDLALKPATAHFIATKLARHFIADEPPPEAVKTLSRAFLDSGGDLPTVYRALIDLPQAWQQPFVKYKTPAEYVISMYRGLELPVDAGRGVIALLETVGQRTYSPGSPAGWPDRGADWDGASALMRRVQLADAIGQKLGARRDAAALAPQLLGDTLGADTRTAIARAASGSQALTLLLAAPEFLRR